MERSHSDKHGGKGGGGPAQTNTLQQSSRIPYQFPAFDANSRAVHFIEEHKLHTKITRDFMCNRGVIETERFISQKALYDIWENRLQDFLRILGCTVDDRALGYVRENLLKILSILVAIEWTQWNRFSGIFLAQTNNADPPRLDESIPFRLDILEDTSFLGCRTGERFYQTQCAFIPIVIEEGEHMECPSWSRLPFIQQQRQHLGTGSYGSVTKEVVAAHQFKWKNSQNLNKDTMPVARKRLTANGDFRKETRNLADLNSNISRHKHIVRYIAIVVTGDAESPKEFNILLPLASMDLKQFLYLPNSELPKFEIVDLLQQASEVANAIQWLHEGLRIKGQVLVCCHMDLKLDNILVYLDEGTPIGLWKISDFGISTLKEPDDVRPIHGGKPEKLNAPSAIETLSSPAESLARLTKTARVRADRPPAIYQAPEFFQGNEVGRSSDVWSFGCILFQILARGVGPDVDKLKELDKLRSLNIDKITRHPTDYFFREGVRSGYYLNPHVKNWLETGFPDRSYKEHELVKACKRLILQILQIDPTRRLKAGQITDKLDDITKDPMSDSMSKNQSQSPISRRRNSVEPLPAISASAVPETPKQRDGPGVARRASAGPSSAATVFTPPQDRNRPPHPFPTGNILQFRHNPSNTRVKCPPSHGEFESPPSAVYSPPPGGTLQAQVGHDSRPLQFQSRNPSNFTTASSSGRTSGSESSNRSHSLASSAESRISTEFVPFDTSPFLDVRNVLKSFVSPTTSNIAFITKKAIFIRTAYNPHSPYRYCTIKTESIEWESGNMAGDFIAAIGTDKTSNMRVIAVACFYTPKVLTNVDIPALQGIK